MSTLISLVVFFLKSIFVLKVEQKGWTFGFYSVVMNESVFARCFYVNITLNKLKKNYKNPISISIKSLFYRVGK